MTSSNLKKKVLLPYTEHAKNVLLQNVKSKKKQTNKRFYNFFLTKHLLQIKHQKRLKIYSWNKINYYFYLTNPWHGYLSDQHYSHNV